jgi:hypothetical protein
VGGAFPILRSALGVAAIGPGWTPAQWRKHLTALESAADRTAEGARRRLADLRVVRPLRLP